MIPNGLAVGVLYTAFIVDAAFASKVHGTTALPAIQNAFLLVGLPIALVGRAIGQSALPRPAAQAANRDWELLRGTLLRAFAAAVGPAIPALLFLIFAGREVIRVLFEHGKYGAAASSLACDVLVSRAIALPAYVASEVATRGLIVLRDIRTPLLTNTVQVPGRAGLVALLVGSVGAIAIPRAFAIMATLEAVALELVLIMRVRVQEASSSDLKVGPVVRPSIE